MIFSFVFCFCFSLSSHTSIGQFFIDSSQRDPFFGHRTFFCEILTFLMYRSIWIKYERYLWPFWSWFLFHAACNVQHWQSIIIIWYQWAVSLQIVAITITTRSWEVCFDHSLNVQPALLSQLVSNILDPMQDPWTVGNPSEFAPLEGLLDCLMLDQSQWRPTLWLHNKSRCTEGVISISCWDTLYSS